MNKRLFTSITVVSYVLVTLLAAIKFLRNGTPGSDIRQIILLLVTLVVLYAVNYLALFDLKHFEIPSLVIYVLIAFSAGLNIVIMFMEGADYEFALYTSRAMVPSSNFIAALIAGSIFGLIVLITKEKGMGVGDILVAIFMGLVLGVKGFVIAFYISLFSALIVGLTLAAFKKRFKNVAVPFVPFMTLGLVISFFYMSEIWNKIQNLFPVN